MTTPLPPAGEYAGCNGSDALNSAGMCMDPTGKTYPQMCDPGDSMDSATGLCVPVAASSASLGYTYTPAVNHKCPAGALYDAASDMCISGSTATTDITTGFEGGDTGDMGDSWLFDPSICPADSVNPDDFWKTWNADATAEAVALAQVGSYVTDPQGDETAFQMAINSADTVNSSAGLLSDAQLSALMAGGNAP